MSESPVLRDFELPATGNQRFQPSAYPAPFILCFHPKDDTPGCTTQGSDSATCIGNSSRPGSPRTSGFPGQAREVLDFMKSAGP